MKIERVTIENFKAIDRFEWDLRDADGEPRRRALLVGENGSGKTSVLQAIAWTLGPAMRIGFQWPGFYEDRIQDSTCHVRVRLDHEELVASPKLERVEISKEPIDIIRGPRGAFEVGPRTVSVLVARANARHQPAHAPLADAPGLLVLHQLRSAGWRGVGAFEQGVQSLRHELMSWDAFHKSVLLGQRELAAGDRDRLGELEVLYNRAFPGTQFIGVRPRSATSNTEYFEIKRDGRVYDLAEASAGEQAILPLLYELVQQDLKRGVVLIDEIELHLHPPLAQALYNLLPVIAPDLQFLMTTHSQAVVDVVPEEEISRIGARSCL